MKKTTNIALVALILSFTTPMYYEITPTSLYIHGRVRFVLISPEDQLRFMQNLAENAAELEVRDGRVVHRQ